MNDDEKTLARLDIPLDRDRFMRGVIRELAGTLEDVVGLEEASGFISLVAQHLAREIEADYKAALGCRQLDRDQVAQVLVDLKARIQGAFRVVEADETKIVFANTACPFAEKVRGRPSMCMMTSNVFGSIAASNLGYARVVLEETIARGDPGCRVIVHLQPDAEETPEGREYYQAPGNP